MWLYSTFRIRISSVPVCLYSMLEISCCTCQVPSVGIRDVSRDKIFIQPYSTAAVPIELETQYLPTTTNFPYEHQNDSTNVKLPQSLIQSISITHPYPPNEGGWRGIKGKEGPIAAWFW